MRGFLNRGLPLIFIPIIFFLLSQGCTRTVLQTYPVSEQDSQAIYNAFARYLEKYQEKCQCCLDAETDAEISVSGWFSDYAGKVSGYLQAMEPGYLKFVAINPLGQPFFVFLTDGNYFKVLNVPENKAYIGSVHSETFRKYSPAGFDPGFSFYWLTGRLQPGEMQIREILADNEQEGYWLLIRFAGSVIDHMVLFDPDELIILRHILQDERGQKLVDLVYEDHQLLPVNPDQSSSENVCKMPVTISVSSRSGTEKIKLELSAFVAGTDFSADDFQMIVPDNFKLLTVR